jgi:thiosulfate dehydrogenase (quinone) large subunit
MINHQRPESVNMSHPAQWLAVLRIVVGLYFVKSLVTKMSIVMLGGVLPIPAVSERWLEVMPKIVARQASENPIAFFKHFLEGTVIPNSNVYASLTAWGETAVGLGLTLGLLTGLASIAGLLLVINYGLATQWMSPGQQGFHIVLFVLMVAFFFARAGRTWGIDGWLARRKPRSLLSRRPFS